MEQEPVAAEVAVPAKATDRGFCCILCRANESNPQHRERAARQRFEGQERMIDRAKAGARAQDNRCLPAFKQVNIQKRHIAGNKKCLFF